MSTLLSILRGTSLIWQTSDGKNIQLKDMDTDYLINCINMIERTKDPNDLWVGLPFRTWVEYMKKEVNHRIKGNTDNLFYSSKKRDTVSFLDI